MTDVFLSLGSNLGDRKRNLDDAVFRLGGISGISIKAESRVIETEPVDVTDQPLFLNQVILVQTELSPGILLEKILSIENDMGRVREIDKGPRIIDIDILMFGTIIAEGHELVIPHPELLNRVFFVELVIELDPEAVYPPAGKKLTEVLL
jgi:2-amino-4-hydroxy-6-hydroxymethyldihydropteridine diphosphokinase